jgi:hypothetical protein
VTAARRNEFAAPFIAAAATLSGALALGGLAILVSRHGAANRPALAVLVLLVGVAAGLVPLRFGLPVAIVLACFEGFMADFIGPRALYWNEAFIALLVVKSLVRKRPSRVEIGAVAGVVIVFCLYFATGTKAHAVYWGLKVLVTSAIALWAIARTDTGRAAWRATYYGLFVGAGASVVLGIWQHSKGVSGLRALGVTDPERLKETGSGTLRVFGGFTSAAPFSYALLIAFALWLGLLLGGRKDAILAGAMSWVPVAAALGLVWTYDRTALFAGAIALLVAGLSAVRRPAVAGVVLAVLITAVAVVMAAGSYRKHVTDALTLRSTVVSGRIALWRSYLHDFSVGGAAPASSGSAYPKAHPHSLRPPLRLSEGNGWWPTGYTRSGRALRWMSYVAPVTLDWKGKRPRLTVTGSVASYKAPRVLAVTDRGRRVATIRIPPKVIPIRFAVPAGHGPARLQLRPTPGADSPVAIQGNAHASVSLQFRSLRSPELDAKATPAQRAYERVMQPRIAIGVVDNQYVSWLFEYGLFGIVLCGLWIAGSVWPLTRRFPDVPLTFAVRFVGVFLLVGALTVNVWEESPTDLLAAIVVGQAFALRRARAA